MAWKPQYAENRRKKYQESEEERERRKSQTRSPEENKAYMSQYYKGNKEEFDAYRRQNQGRINALKRMRYHTDPAYREICKARSRKRDKFARRHYRLMAEYKITAEEYVTFFEQQSGKCAICGKQFTIEEKAQLLVDHDHTTGAVRGLLCSNCNFGIGHFKDDIGRLKAAIEYLKQFNTEEGDTQ